MTLSESICHKPNIRLTFACLSLLQHILYMAHPLNITGSSGISILMVISLLLIVI